MYYILHPSHHPWCDHHNNNWWRVQRTELITEFFFTCLSLHHTHFGKWQNREYYKNTIECRHLDIPFFIPLTPWPMIARLAKYAKRFLVRFLVLTVASMNIPVIWDVMMSMRCLVEIDWVSEVCTASVTRVTSQKIVIFKLLQVICH